MRALVVLAAVAAALSAAPDSSAAAVPVRWCGNDVQQADRLRDRVGGPQIHVVYVIPADGQDRFGQLATPITTDVAAIDAWWRREDPSRAPRFDLFEFPGCESRLGLLDLSSVRLPRPAASYASLDARFEAVVDDLSGSPFEHGDLDKKYLVFYDGVIHEDDVCGIGAGRPSRGPAYAVVYLRSGCGLELGTGGSAAWVAAHELVHALGAVDDVAPNGCENGHVCDSSTDLMFSRYGGGFLDEARLDVGRDDYYAHQGPRFDVRLSPWLLDPAAQLTLTLRVTGRGLIGSQPDDQGCSAVCVGEWDGGTAVQLAAEPAAGYGFSGWTGACARERDSSCLLDLTTPTEVGAVFRPLGRLTVSLSGRGAVTGAGVRCTRRCVHRFVQGRRVALRATAARGWRFVRWTGGCRGSRPSCTVAVGAAARVTAVFARRS